MNWVDLLAPVRLSGTTQAKDTSYRSLFQEDWDRVVFCSAFRRLQGKTQVHPFPETDYTHTRLTHSIETASVGRSLGHKVGLFLAQAGHLPNLDPSEIGAIVSTACLIHDIGNTPYGHSGEDTLQEWFTTFFEHHPHLDAQLGLSDLEKSDFLKFEGNAQGFRTVTRLQGTSNDFGLDLTLPVLAASMKYPRFSLLQAPWPEKASAKKFHVFQSERWHFETLTETLGLIPREPGYHCRHPLAFLVEAADDICYTIIDIEDAFKLHIIDYDTAYNHLQALVDLDQLGHANLDCLSHPDKRISKLRAMAIDSLIREAARLFTLEHEHLLTGTYDKPLLKHPQCQFHEGLQAITFLSETDIYEHRKKLQLEMAGFRIVSGLLDHAIPAALAFINHRDKSALKTSHRKLLKLFNFPFADEEAILYNQLRHEPPYQIILKITDYISGMTDEFAQDTYKKLMGLTV